ncbi:MAG TPA: 2-C-methyl-D-erythritol 2,4-cyclodiphosphate synthase [Actinobacteria bacterium]|nr:2-C-methyl-D-erythritol 2,4-cyclodiphosphate synthase [Actinomycetota bacterium]
MRVGIGFDVHAFATGRKLILGGVEIDHEKGLEGHSDADVLVHAIMDAILGACGLEDIGIHFPDTDMKYKDISSLALLEEVGKKMEAEGFEIENIDTVLILQEPKVFKYFEKMKENIAGTLKIDTARINLKATTTEYLGFCGRGEGIAAQAIALLK